MKIRTEFVNPPIPDRRHDWCAVDDDTYDGPGSKIGRGETELEAIADLIEQMQDADVIIVHHKDRIEARILTTVRDVPDRIVYRTVHTFDGPCKECEQNWRGLEKERS